MLEDKIDVGDGEEQATEIDLDAQVETTEAPKEEIVVEEETTEVEKEEKTKAADELGEYSEGVQKRIAKLTR